MIHLRPLAVLLVVVLVSTSGVAAYSFGTGDAPASDGVVESPISPVLPYQPPGNASPGSDADVRPAGHGGHTPQGPPLCVGPDTAFGTLVAAYVANERATNGTDHLGANVSSFVITWTSQVGSVHHALVSLCEDDERSEDSPDETDSDTGDETDENSNIDDSGTDDGGDDTTDTDGGNDTDGTTGDDGDDTGTDTDGTTDGDGTDTDSTDGDDASTDTDSTDGDDASTDTGDVALTDETGAESGSSGTTEGETDVAPQTGDGTDDGSETDPTNPPGGTIPTIDPVPPADGTGDDDPEDGSDVTPTDDDDESDSGILGGETGDGDGATTELVDDSIAGQSLGQSLLWLLLLVLAAIVARQGVKLYLRTG